MACFGQLSTTNRGGTTSGAAMLCLCSPGAMDQYLTANAQSTFFKNMTSRCTNFGNECIQQNFTNTVAFGSEVTVKLNRTGDLITRVYLVLNVPAITAVWSRSKPCPFPVSDPCDPCGDGDLECGPCDLNKRCTKVQGGVYDDEHLSHGYSAEGYDSYTGYGSSSDSTTGSSSTSGSGSSSSSSSGSSSSLGSTSVDSCTGIRGPYAHWVNELGHAVIGSVSFSIGGQTIDTHYSHFMHMWEELTGKAGKRLREMIGKYNTVAELVHASRKPTTLWVPLDFYFCEEPGDNLPLVSLQFHDVSIQVKLAPLEKLVQVSHCNVEVVRCVDGAPLTKQDISATIASDYIYLDMQERDCFATGSFQGLIKQVQTFSTTSRHSSNVNMSLNFNHPTLEILWAGQRKCQAEKNNTFNYSGAFGRDIFTNIALTLNGMLTFQNGPEYFRLVQPYEHHSHFPDNFIYCYSWALYPESHQPSGSINLSRIDSMYMDFCIQPPCQTEDIAIYVFAVSWNILRYKDGLGGLMYSSNPLFAGSTLAINWI